MPVIIRTIIGATFNGARSLGIQFRVKALIVMQYFWGAESALNG